MENVQFKRFDGAIIALFPNIKDGLKRNFIQSYMHVGQHGMASPELLNELEDANYNEYADLLKELISIGYKLEVDSQQNVEARRQPTPAEVRFGRGAIHYRTFSLDEFINPLTGGLKRWIKAADGLRYYR